MQENVMMTRNLALPSFVAAPVVRPFRWFEAKFARNHRKQSILSSPLHSKSKSTRTGFICSSTTYTSDLRQKISDLAGTERGIFGLDKPLRLQIHQGIQEAEANSPNVAPARDNAVAVDGSWRLLYTTLTILGRRRVRLAIGTLSKPGFIRLGEFYQVVDSEKHESRNVVVFDMALGGSGTFTITAKFNSESDKRVSVQTISARLEPQSLENLLGDKISLLTEIFDPTGYLDITYLDDDLRVGRDDKGNIFVLERCSLN